MQGASGALHCLGKRVETGADRAVDALRSDGHDESAQKVGIDAGFQLHGAAFAGAQLADLKTKLTAREGRTVKLSTKVDPELLGGLVVTIGSKRIDGSIRTRLNSLSQAMKA